MSAPFDHHVHSVVSGDSEVPLEDRARTAQVPERPHGISDHFPSPHLRDDDEVLRYVERARALGLRVALEYSLGEAPSLRPSTRDALDYLVGGLHQVRVGGVEVSFDDAGAYLKGRLRAFQVPRTELATSLLEGILRVVAAACEEVRLDILGHPTLSPLAAFPDPETAYPAEWQDRLFALCVRHGVALEVNESYRLPHPGFLRRARAAGATFSVGSDSHGPLLPLTFTEKAIGDAELTTRLRDPSVLNKPSADQAEPVRTSPPA